MIEKIQTSLDSIEQDYQVKIILACESGSRAWGFPSMDSDYDVRFIYAQQRDRYLSIVDRKDVIEMPPDEILDINGWDLKKALQLLKKSNSPLLEWLVSPIRYREWTWALDPIVALSQRAFLPETVCHHYLAMAKRMVAGINETQQVRLKQYMYAVRAVLCCQWVIKYRSFPPMEIDRLLSGLPLQSEIRQRIQTWIASKKNRTEAYSIERSKTVDRFLDEKLKDLPPDIPGNPAKINTDAFDRVFRTILNDNG